MSAKPPEESIFDKIVSRKISADILFEDDLAIAFRDIAPAARVHFLVVPKERGELSTLSKAKEGDKELLGHLLLVAA